MIVPGAPNPLLWGAGDPLDELGVIGHSVRFNSPDGAYLTRTPTVTGNRKTWSFRWWGKVSELVDGGIFGAGATSDETYIYVAGSKLQVRQTIAAAEQWQLLTTRVFRDLSAHAEIQVDVDTTQATASDRVRVYVNGELVTVFDVASYPALNSDTWTNHTVAHYIGKRPGAAVYFGGYISDPHLLDGFAPGPTVFGAIHPKTNQWRPKAYSGTYGTNGFHLDFSDGSAATSAALGADRSGNGNNWTPTNISVTAGAGNDWLLDSPTNNFATFASVDPLPSPFTVIDGGLQLNANGSTVSLTRRALFGLTSGVWQWEIVQTAGANAAQRIGIVKNGASLATTSEVGADAYGWGYQWSNGNKINAGSSSAYGATATTNDVIGVVFDADAGTLTFYKNGVSQGVAFSGLTSGPYYPAVSLNSFNHVLVANLGQRAFAYPVAGAKAVGTKYLSQSSSVTVSGTFTGNAAADGPQEWINGSPETLTINSNAVTFGTHADRLAGGFKLRTSSASYNTAGSNTWTATIVSNIKNIFRHQNARGN